MADTHPSSKHPPAPTVETDDENGDSSASKPASNSKRTRKASRLARDPASNVEQPVPDHPKVKYDIPSRPKESVSRPPGPEDNVTSESGTRRAHKPRRQSEVPPLSSPRKPSKEQRPRSSERHARDNPLPGQPCACSDCLSAPRYILRPGVSPLQHEQRAYTVPPQTHHVPPPVVQQVPFYPSSAPVPGLVPPQMRPRYLPGSNYPVGHAPPPGPAYDPRLQPMRTAMPPPPHPSMYPPSLPGIRGPPSPVKQPLRPAIHHHERRPTASSGSQFKSSKISTYDDFSTADRADGEERFSARSLPTRQHVPGAFESDSYSSASPPDSPEYFDREQSVRPHPPRRATTSGQVHGHARSGSDHPAESRYHYNHGQQYPDQRWEQHSDYGSQRALAGGRRGSIASSWTHQTSASDPPDHRYVHYSYPERGNDYTSSEHAAKDYMNRARGYPEGDFTAETLRHSCERPRSTRSNHSHRHSQHSVSEGSSRHEGSVRLIMPISAAEQTRIQLSGDMGDREVTVRSTDDPGQVEVTIGAVNVPERRYLRSGSQSSHAPTRSSGSTRHATRGRTEGQEQVREHRHTSRAPSLRR
jgi:hypothetical protein